MVDDAEILRARARALARPPELAPEPATLVEVLEFRLAHERYAVETRYVREVSPLVDLTRVPCTPPFVIGVVNVRGRVVPVIDLKKLFDLPEQGLTDLHRVILLEGNGLELGLLADIIVDVRAVPAESVRTSVATLTGIREEYLRGVTEERVIVLDTRRILADPKLIVDEGVDS